MRRAGLYLPEASLSLACRQPLSSLCVLRKFFLCVQAPWQLSVSRFPLLEGHGSDWIRSHCGSLIFVSHLLQALSPNTVIF